MIQDKTIKLNKFIVILAKLFAQSLFKSSFFLKITKIMMNMTIIWF